MVVQCHLEQECGWYHVLLQKKKSIHSEANDQEAGAKLKAEI